VTIALAIVAVAGVFLYVGRQPPLTEKDTILLADFVNATGEPEFDGNTLKQALSGSLRQTPFLNLFPEEATRETLRMMGRPADQRVTREVAREISQRQKLKALLVGSPGSGTGIRVVGERDVLVQRLRQGEPGQLGKISRRMAEAGVNIEVQYSDHDHQLILVVDDLVKGRAVSEAWDRESGA
jgi:hypothetical protein